MESTISKGRLWAGRILTGLVLLFLLFDGITKVIKERHTMEASAQLGFAPNTIVAIGAVLLFCTLLYVIPRTTILGAVLLTGYLGGAVEANVQSHMPTFNLFFPVMFGVLVWLALMLRDDRARAFLFGEITKA